MDLRTPSRQRHHSSAGTEIQKLPNILRYTAIAESLPYVTKSELDAIHLQLIELCQPPEPSNNPLIASIRAKRTEQDAKAARQAARTLMASWDKLAPVTRRLALAAEAVDWATLAPALLDEATDPEQMMASIDAITAFYADAESSNSDTLRADPRVLSRLLCSGSRRAVALAESRVLTEILAGVPTPPAEIPETLREHRAAQAGTDPSAVALATDAAIGALDTYDLHGRTPIATAALLLLDRPESDPASRAVQPLRTLLANPDHPAFGVLRRTLKRSTSPAVRRIAWRALKPGPLAMAALERLSAANHPGDHDTVLCLAHLLLNPARAAVLAGINARPPANRKSRPTQIRSSSIACLIPPADAPLTSAASRGLASLLVRTDDAASRTIHARLLTSPDDHARLTSARHATDGRSLADLCLDPSPAVARAAALRRSPVGVAGPTASTEPSHRQKFTALLARSPHASVRRIASEDLAQSALLTPTGFPSIRALTLAQRDPEALSTELKELLHADEPRTRVSAIRAACRLGVVGTWHDELATIIEGSMPTDQPASVIAATAAAALGAIPRHATMPTVISALDHPDPRVRANAVESLERLVASLGPDPAHPSDLRPTDRLSEIKRSPEHRARANAIRAASRLRIDDEPDGAQGDELVRMLTDDRPPHRLAAVWLAERLLCDPRRPAGPPPPQWRAAARGVAAIARDEPDTHTRARAARCARRLLAEVARPAAHADPALGATARRLRGMAVRAQSATDAQPSEASNARPLTGARA